MSVRLDHAMVERAAAGGVLRLPRVPHRGKLGEVRANSVGSSLELHDFRQYAPGDDLRHIDWNAVARTGELFLRVRQDEVSPRVEVLLDGSASMAVSEEKAARSREIAAWLCTLARRGGLEPSLIVTGTTVRKAFGPQTAALLEHLEFDGKEPFDLALRRAPPLRPCGLRIVISDFLFESPPGPFSERLARQTSGLALVQVLDAEDLDPSGGAGAQLTDSESGEVLERILTPGVVDQYLARFSAHVRLWQGAAQRVHATWVQANAMNALDRLARRELMPLMEAS